MEAVKHDTELEASKMFSDTVNARMNGRWLGLFLAIDDNGNMTLDRTSFKFDSGRFLEVVSLIARDLLEESQSSFQEKEPPTMPLDQFLELQKKLKEKVENENNPATLPLRDDDPVHGSLDDTVTESLKEEKLEIEDSDLDMLEDYSKSVREQDKEERS